MNLKFKAAELVKEYRNSIENMVLHGDKFEKALALAALEYAEAKA